MPEEVAVPPKDRALELVEALQLLEAHDLPERELEVAIAMLMGSTVEETARRLGMAEGTVKATRNHVKEKLASD